MLDAPEPDRTVAVLTFALHPLVREVVAHTIPATDRTRYLAASTKQLLTTADEIGAAGRSGWATAPLLVPHLVQLLAATMTNEPDKLVPVRDRLDQVAALLQDAGNFVAELPLRDAVLAAEDSSLGSDHPDTLASRGNLANAYQAAGRTTEAIPLHERTLADPRSRSSAPTTPTP